MSSSDRSQLTDRQHHLPDLSLESDAGAVSLQRPGRSVLILCVHDASCEACVNYVAEVSANEDEIGSWSCDVAIVSCSRESATYRLPPSFRLLSDPAQKIAAATGIACPGVILADEWADITFARAASDAHDFPAMARLISEVRYLGTRCPECEGEAL